MDMPLTKALMEGFSLAFLTGLERKHHEKIIELIKPMKKAVGAAA